ncbi:MAG: outer membrane protein assembly factor BamD [Smithella sp.]|nr:outer membrane protein assembly factor BamD [Smithella sp.]
MRIRTISIIMAAVLLFSGCSLTKASILSFFGKRTPVVNTPEALYARGTADYQDGRYKKARAAFTRLKEEYPLHELAVLAELGIADSYYSNKDYLEAEGAYRDFVELHPTDENVPYAIYQTGMCHYQQIEDIDRDQTQTVRARREFEKLTARYPQSRFALLAEKMTRECNAQLAEHEFYVGNFYFKLKKYEAALARFEGIRRGYPGVGLDLKVDAYIAQTARLLEEERKAQKLKEEKDKKGFFRRFLP